MEKKGGEKAIENVVGNLGMEELKRIASYALGGLYLEETENGRTYLDPNKNREGYPEHMEELLQELGIGVLPEGSVTLTVKARAIREIKLDVRNELLELSEEDLERLRNTGGKDQKILKSMVQRKALRDPNARKILDGLQFLKNHGGASAEIQIELDGKEAESYLSIQQ